MYSNEWIGTFETYMEQVMKEASLPGVAIGLAKDGQLFYEKGYGYRDVENKLNVTMDTVFAIGSITKTFTCIALMQLQEKGRIHLHDPIRKYLPNFRLKNGKYIDEMTIHHFMTHTSGIPNLHTFPMVTYNSLTEEDFQYDPTIYGNINDFYQLETYGEYLDYISRLDVEMLCKPGEEWHYNNDCYGILGLIIEQVSGQKYEDYVKENILEPAGMFSTSYYLDDLQEREVTKIYMPREVDGNITTVETTNWWDTPVQRAAGFLKSTVADMVKFMEIFRTGGTVGTNQILEKNSVEQMMQVHSLNNPFIQQGYGYGLSIIPNYFGSKLLEHAGGIKGGGAQIFIIPEKGLSGVVLTNILSTAPTAILNSAFNCIENRPLEAIHVERDQNNWKTPMLSDYVGKYQSKSVNLFVLVDLKKNSTLQANVLGASVSLTLIKKDIFLINGTFDSIEFKRSNQNKIVEVKYKGYVFKKVEE
jgi:CubicO group peptidase (beta-lactamase class C family)